MPSLSTIFSIHSKHLSLQEIISENKGFTIVPLSDRSLLVSFGNTIDPLISGQVLILHHSLQQNSFHGFIESVPAYASLAVFYDVIIIRKMTGIAAFAFVKNLLLQRLQQNHPTAQQLPVIKEIPVCYDDDFGFDIGHVAHIRGINVHEVISLHTSILYQVYMIGFMPGFAYMGAVAEKLITPRKHQPSPMVPAGSVGIAGAQTGIYPLQSPGGWQIIGRTPLHLFDAASASPCLLAAGDRVQFVSINKKEFEAYGH